MKALCVCQYGHSRSVALVRELHGRGIPAVACGWGSAGTALDVLTEWADTIFVMQTEFKSRIPLAQQHKVVPIDVGPDRWVNPMHPELAALVKRLYLAWSEQKDPCLSSVDWKPSRAHQ